MMRRTAKRRNYTLPAIILSILVIAGVLGTVVFLDFRRSGNEPIRQDVSLSEEAAARAYIWLNQIDDMPLSYQEIKAEMGDIRLQLLLIPTGGKGIYLRELEDGSFDACRDQARNGLEKAYRATLRSRLHAAGYEGEISDAMLDDTMREAYGMSIAEYLDFCNVQLLPAQEELAGMYSGEVAYERD